MDPLLYRSRKGTYLTLPIPEDESPPELTPDMLEKALPVALQTLPRLPTRLPCCIDLSQGPRAPTERAKGRAC